MRRNFGFSILFSVLSALLLGCSAHSRLNSAQTSPTAASTPTSGRQQPAVGSTVARSPGSIPATPPDSAAAARLLGLPTKDAACVARKVTARGSGHTSSQLRGLDVAPTWLRDLGHRCVLEVEAAPEFARQLRGTF